MYRGLPQRNSCSLQSLTPMPARLLLLNVNVKEGGESRSEAWYPVESQDEIGCFSSLLPTPGARYLSAKRWMGLVVA